MISSLVCRGEWRYVTSSDVTAKFRGRRRYETPPTLQDRILFDSASATHDNFGGAGKSCLASGGDAQRLIQNRQVMPHPGRCYARCFFRGVKSCLLLLIKGGVTMTRGVMVWEVVKFQSTTIKAVCIVSM